MVFAIACLAFWSQARLGELLFYAAFDPHLHITCDGIKFGMSTSNRCYGKGWLPCTKTKPGSDWLLFTDSQCTNSTCCSLKWHLSSNSLVPNAAPLLAFKTLDGTWFPMQKNWFLTQCNSIWVSHFPSPISGHSFQIGGTTHLFLLSIDVFIIMVQGHWSSNAFLSYWQKCKEIIPLFIASPLTLILQYVMIQVQAT